MLTDRVELYGGLNTINCLDEILIFRDSEEKGGLNYEEV